jgi:hypothetical protein
MVKYLPTCRFCASHFCLVKLEKSIYSIVLLIVQKLLSSLVARFDDTF